MEPPVFYEIDSIVLSVDDIDLKFQECMDGQHVDVIGDAGVLSDDPVQEERQISSILQHNLARWLNNRTCVCTEKSLDGSVMLRCYGRYAYASRNVGVLVNIVEEVLGVTEHWYSELMQGVAESQDMRRRQMSTQLDMEDAVLFKA